MSDPNQPTAKEASSFNLFRNYETNHPESDAIKPPVRKSEPEIDWYIATREPFGKAGAYGIQGKAALFIEEIEGDYFNIMGLPIRLVYELTS